MCGKMSMCEKMCVKVSTCIENCVCVVMSAG